MDIGGNVGGGYPRSVAQIVDLYRDFRVYIWYGDVKFGKKVTADPTYGPGFFSIPQLEKEYFWRKAPNYRPVTSAEHFPPYPHIYEEKKAKDRQGIKAMPESLKKKIKEHQEMWDKRGGFDPWGWAKRTKYQEVK